MTALLWASLKGHLPVVRELVNVYKVNVFQKDKVRLILMHLLQYTTICHIEPPTYTDKPFVLACSPYHQIMESI